MTGHHDPLARLSAEGVSVWLDDISRDRLLTGNLRRLVDERHVVGVTSNPSIFQAAVTKSSAYDAQLDALRQVGADAEQAVRDITTEDVRNGCDLLAELAQRRPGDGRVSLEVDPRLARETDATIVQARELWGLVGRPNLYIKIPATQEGLRAITTAVADGISVNVTLIFALERYRAVMEAYAAGLERRLDAGEPLDGIASVASFFVSRVDTEVDKRLATTVGDRATDLKGRAAIANARLAYAAYEEFVSTERWGRLEAAGAARQRPLWASTSTKDPDLPDTLYVTELVAPGTVNTMPEPTIEAVADHGEIRGDTVRTAYDDAAQTMAALERAGVDMDDVTRVLEVEGVEKFETSWNDLLATVEARLEAGR